MSDLQQLYQEVIIDHGRCPRNCRELPDANRVAEGHNPLCGDEVKIYLRVENDVVVEASFTGTGCAISTASASILTEEVKGKSVEEALNLVRRFREAMTSVRSMDEDMGRLAAFEGVKGYPMRVKCATLAWHTLHAALENRSEKATSE